MKRIYEIISRSLTLLCLCGTAVLAQNATVKGTVGDASGSLPGVSILLKGTNQGTTTDQNGQFQLTNVPTSATLIFSFIGYETQEVPLNGRSELSISLKESTNTLDEVVVSGYGIETLRRDVSGAVSKIDQSTLKNTAPVSVSELLQGRAAGVNVVSNDGAPGGGISINIRGLSSISAGGSPLVVIDNIPYLNSDSDVTNPLANLNPNDIESIDILKDASATALYGVGATNGVIVITTKRGQRGKPRINFSAKGGVGKFARNLETLTPQEYALYRAQRVRAEAGNNNGLQAAIRFPGQPSAWELLANPTGFASDADPYKTLTDVYGVTNFDGTNWLDAITQNTVKQLYDLDFSGATETGTSYFGSIGYANEKGAIINSGFTRLSGRLNVDQKISKILTAGLKLQYTHSNYEGLIGDWRADNAIAQSNFLNPFINRDNILGSADGITNNGGQGAGPESPEFRIKNTDSNRGSNWFSGNLNLSLKPLPWLEFAFTGGIINEDSDRDYYVPSNLREAQNVRGRADLYKKSDSRWTLQPRIAINKQFEGGHKLNATFVFEARKEIQDEIFTRYEQFNTEVLGAYSLPSAKNIFSTPSYSDKRDRSYIGRIQYDYKSRYILTASTRIDQSSRFINDNTGVFPAISAAWNISEEKFMDFSSKYLSSLKIRAGYGVTGNNQIPLNSGVPLATISNVSYPFNNALNTAINPNDRFANRDITWETTKGTNVGLDFGFFNDRLALSTNYYRNETTGLLLNIQLPAYSGFNTSIQNIGSLENRGFELEVTSRNIVGPALRWTTNFNISFNRNKILSLGDQPELGFRAIGVGGQPNDVLLRVGKPIGTYYGTIQNGLINNDIERYNSAPKVQDNNTGEFDFFDIDGNGAIDRFEYVPIAQTLPIHTGGIGNTLSYKGFDLYAFLRWSYGNDIMNNNINRAMYLRGDNNLQRNIVDEIWNRQNDDRNYQSTTAIFTTRINSLFPRSEMVEDGSYLRLETVKVAYSVPVKFLSKYKIGAAKISLTGQNLFLLTRYSWYDPEVNAASGSNRQLFPGIDQGSYPRSRFYLLGLDLTFWPSARSRSGVPAIAGRHF